MKNKMFKIILKKLIIIFAFVLLLVDNLYAEYTHVGMMPYENDKNVEYKKNVLYPEFIEAIKKKENYCSNNIGRIFFDDRNNNLIIGCSPVSYMSLYAQDIVDNYHYDIVGFGSTVDSDILEWLKLIEKTYNTIVIWGSANDIMTAIMNGIEIGDEYFSILDNVFMEAEQHLNKSPNSKIVYINVKEMVEGLDTNEEWYCKKYNYYAKKINDYVKMKEIASIDITSETNRNNSEWYLHYISRNVFNKILQELSFIDG